MPLTIPDESLLALRMTEEAARVEIACRLFDAEFLGLNDAARLAGVSRGEMKDALWDRGLAIYHYTAEMLEEDMRGVKLTEEADVAGAAGR